MRNLLFTFLIAVSLLAGSFSAWADGGIVQMQKEIGNYRITLFSEPSPLCAGPADMSVLLQKNGEAVLDANVILHLEYADQKPVHAAWEPLCCSMDAGSAKISVPATHDRASNKLLYSAPAIFPYSGKWKATVIVQQGGNSLSATGNFFVQKPVAPVMAYFPYLLLPIAGIGFFAMVQAAKKDRRRKS